MRGPGRRCLLPLGRRRRLSRRGTSSGRLRPGCARASDPRFRRMRTGCGLSLRRRRRGQWARDRLRRHSLNRPRSRRSSSSCCEGSWACRSWGCCCLCLTRLAGEGYTPTRHARYGGLTQSEFMHGCLPDNDSAGVFPFPDAPGRNVNPAFEVQLAS